MPTVGWVRKKYIGCLLETIMDILFDDARFTDRLTSQEDNFDFSFASDCTTDWVVHNLNISLYLPSECIVRTKQKRPTTQSTWKTLSSDLLPTTYHFSTSLNMVLEYSCRKLEICNCSFGEYVLCLKFWSRLFQIQYFFARNKLPLLVFLVRIFTWHREKRNEFLLLDLTYILKSF